MKKITFLFLVILIYQYSFAQYVQVGDGTVTGFTANLPVHTGYRYSYTQNIFYPSEINQSGFINGISWSVGNGANPLSTLQEAIIYIGTTNKSTFDSETDWIPITQLTKVYEGAITGSPNSWTPKFTFSTPFFYNGVDNLVVVVDENSSQWQPSHNGFFSTSVTGNRGIVYWGDSTNPNPASPPNGTLKAYIANTRFYMDEISCNNAELLDVGLTFSDNSITRQTLPNYTGTGITPVPTCGNYSGGDYWYSVVIPSNGDITIETKGTSGDTAIDVYSGTCGALTLLACDDNSGDNNFSRVDINQPSLIGETIYIRVWEPGNSNLVTYEIAAWSPNVPVIPATSLSFDGTNDAVNCGNNASVQITGNTITLEAMVKFNSFKSNAFEGSIINKEQNSPDNGYMLRAGGTGIVQFLLGSGSWNVVASPSNAIQTGVWHHIAATYDGSAMRLYVDGIEVAVTNTSFTINNSTSNLIIGDWPSGGRNLNAEMDEVRIWNIARTITELNDNKDCELNGSETGLVAYYKFNQGNSGLSNSTETTLLDATSYGNNGTLTNFALTGNTSNWKDTSPVITGNSCTTITLGVDDVFEQSTLTLHPNPSKDIINLASNQEIESITLHNILGQSIKTIKINAMEYTMDISELYIGTYFVKITIGKSVISKRFIKL